ncbi:MAG: histidine kinase dimerization/phospho-acceptor domain-containing protein, partial [Myxococcota bacterium]
MKEVSCRIYLVCEEAWLKRGQPVDALVDGVGYPVDYLRRKHERIEWSSYQRLLMNMRTKMQLEDFIDVGTGIFGSRGYAAIASIGRLLFSADDFYRYGHKNRQGSVNQLFNCVYFRTEEAGPNTLRISYDLAPGYSTDPAYFFVGLGAMIAAPSVLGLPRAEVQMEHSETSATYTVAYPSGGGALSWIRKAVTWPFALRTAGIELRDAYEALQARYEQLEDYRQNLDQRVKERTAELAAAKDELSATVVQLREAQAIRDRFFSNVNHEIRTPLSLISIGVDDVLARYETQLDDRARSSLELSLDGVQNLVGLVDELLLLAAGQEGKLTLQRSRYDL